jgi:hypothetical protein
LPPLTGSHARQFKVYWGDFEGKQSVARIRYRLTVIGDQYEVRTEGEAQGLISLVYSGTLTQVSIGTMGPGGLVPRRYAESRGRSAERAVSFDPEASQLLPPGGTDAPHAFGAKCVEQRRCSPRVRNPARFRRAGDRAKCTAQGCRRREGATHEIAATQARKTNVRHTVNVWTMRRANQRCPIRRQAWDQTSRCSLCVATVNFS